MVAWVARMSGRGWCWCTLAGHPLRHPDTRQRWGPLARGRVSPGVGDWRHRDRAQSDETSPGGHTRDADQCHIPRNKDQWSGIGNKWIQDISITILCSCKLLNIGIDDVDHLLCKIVYSNIFIIIMEFKIELSSPPLKLQKLCRTIFQTALDHCN